MFVSRCVAYPFNAKQPLDMTKRPLKVTKQQLETICSRFQVILPSLLSFLSSFLISYRKCNYLYTFALTIQYGMYINIYINDRDIENERKRKVKKGRTKETFWIRCNVSDGRSRIPFYARNRL